MNLKITPTTDGELIRYNNEREKCDGHFASNEGLQHHRG